MKFFKHIAFFLLIISSFSVVGTSTFEEGVDSFGDEKYALSAEKFDSIVQVSPHNIGAIYNLGIARLNNKQYGEAIWAFERVLKSQPNDAEVKEKIHECYYQLDPDYYWEFRLNGFQSILYAIPPNTWGIISILSSIIISLMIVLFIKNNAPTFRRIALFTGFIFLIIFLFSLITGYFTLQYRTQDNRAVVLMDEVQIFENENEKMIHEGDILECEQCEGDTILFKTANQQEVFLLKEDVGFI